MENNAVKTKETEEKVSMTTKEKTIFGLKIAGNVVFYAVIILLFLFAIFNINGGNGTTDFPNIFGKGYLSVASDSMVHDESKEYLAEWNNYPQSKGFKKQDLVTDSHIKNNQKKINKLKIGDVITFSQDVDGDGTPELNTHRIVDIYRDSNGNVLNVTTQGDARAQSNNYFGDARVKLCAYLVIGSDRANATGMTNAEIAAFDYYLESNKFIENVDVKSICGLVTGVSVNGGKVLENIQKNYLFYFVMPVAVLLIFEIFLVVKNIMAFKGEKNKAELESTREQMIADVEAEKEKMRQELLAEMKAQGLVATAPQTPVEEAKADNAEETKPETVEEKVEETTEEVTETPVTDNNTEEK